MNAPALSFKALLSGENAFYNHANYETVTRQELDSPHPLTPPAYTCTFESKIGRVVKNILSTLIFPIGLYRLLHSLAGKMIIPATLDSLNKFPNYANIRRQEVMLTSEWKMKRISVEVDGNMIDAILFGKASTLGNGRWVLPSLGNAMFYEDFLNFFSFKDFLTQLNGNALLFNYPGVGCSRGLPHRMALTKAYQALLNLLEDQEKGVGAQEIIGYGWSMGGGIQNEALRTHQLKQGIKYLFVKRQTFSDLGTAVSHIKNRPTFFSRLLALVVKFFGWNISLVETSRKLTVPEIILEKVEGEDYIDISKDPQKISFDGVVGVKASLAKSLLNFSSSFAGKKYFMGISETHQEPLKNSLPLVNKIKEMLEDAEYF